MKIDRLKLVGLGNEFKTSDHENENLRQKGFSFNCISTSFSQFHFRLFFDLQKKKKKTMHLQHSNPKSIDLLIN